MKTVKMRNAIKGVKTLDRAVNLSSKMKNAAVRTKGKAEEAQEPHGDSPNEYATKHLQTSARNGVLDGAHHLKAAPKTAQKNIARAKGHFQAVRQQMPQERQHAATQARQTAQTTRTNADKLHKTADQAEQTAKHTKSAAQDAKGTLKQVRHDGRQAVLNAKQETHAQKPNAPNRIKPSTAANHAKPSPGNVQAASIPSNATPIKAVPRKATPPNITSPRKATSSHGAKPPGKTPFRPTYTKAPPRAAPKKATQAAAQSTKSARKTVKQTAKGTIKTAKKSVKTAEQTAKVTVKTTQRTARATRQSAKAAAKAAKVAERTSRAVAKTAVQTAKAAAKGVTAMVKATIAAIKGLVAAIAAGGSVAVFIILIVCLIGLIVASPLGIFFAGDARDGIPLSAAVAHINAELTTEMEERQNERIYDDIVMDNGYADWVDVVAVYACKLAGAENDANDVTTFDADRIERLEEVMRDMSGIEYDTERIVNPEADTQYVLHINTSVLTTDSAATRYGFTANQREALAALLDNRAELAALIGDLTISNSVARDLLAGLPDDLSPERAGVVKMALSLVGKVNYFWGGKSYAEGWDSTWGTLRRVTADGSSTTGTYRPFGWIAPATSAGRSATQGYRTAVLGTSAATPWRQHGRTRSRATSRSTPTKATLGWW